MSKKSNEIDKNNETSICQTNWPLTFAEEQMAVEQGVKKNSTSYNINFAFGVSGNLDIKRLEDALNQLIKRQPILRSKFPMLNGEYVHACMEQFKVEIVQYTCEKEAVEEEIYAVNTPFDLEKGKLIRCNVFKHGGDKATLNICIHHIIMDRAGSDPFFEELFKLYEGGELPEIKLTYFDEETRHNDACENKKAEEAMLELFKDGVPENDMPTVAVRPEVLPVSNCEIFKEIPSKGISTTARLLGLTKYEFLIGTLGMIVGKYCNSESVVIGTAMSGRTKACQKDVIGNFVNEVAIPMRPVGDRSVVEYFKQVKNTVGSAKSSQIHPFGKLVEALAPDRNSSKAPIFDVLFNYIQQIAIPTIQVDGIEIVPLNVKRQKLAMDITLEVVNDKDSLILSLRYSDTLYEKEVMDNFMEQYLYSIEQICAKVVEGGDSSSLIVNEVTELPTEQYRTIVEDFVGAVSDEVKGKTVLELFREQVKKTPSEVAIVFGGERMTYKELDESTDSLALYLAKERENGMGSVVGIMVHRSIVFPICTIAAMKAGVAYLPLDPEYPTDRLEYMCQDAGADVLIGHADLFQKVSNYSGKFIDVSVIGQLDSGDYVKEELEKLELSPKEDDLFILLYTSGTTGKPKGVMLTNRNIANFINFYKREYRLGVGEKTLAYASFGFDANMMDMYPTLISGATLHIIPEEMRLDITAMADYVEENGITVAFMTTQLGRQFVEIKEPKTLKAFSVGGETLTPIAPPRFSFYNLYGPTECTIASNRYLLDKLYDRVPIGKPVDNTNVYVVDKYGRLAPVGVAGELCISGRQVAKGYLNRPDLTAEKFVSNPYTDNPDYSRMYKSGDVVRFLPSGDIDFVGRRDFQVKIRGFRIELTEIEGRIREFEGVTDATVIAVDNPAGGKRVVAYLVADETVSIEELNSFIEEKLPSYMVPSGTMQIDKIPLNQNGKVNRKELPEIIVQEEEIIPPSNELEEKLHQVVGAILGTSTFGITTDLMYAGLNSLSAIKAAALISEVTGKKLSTLDLMEKKTIQKIGRFLIQSDDYEAVIYEKREVYPLTENQLGVYFACSKEPESLAYNIPLEISFSRNIDVKKLKDSIVNVIGAHSYILTNLVMKNREPMQLPRLDRTFDIPIKEYQRKEFEKKRENFIQPFNLFEGPLFRGEICKLEDEVIVLFDAHHIIFDGGSLDIFLKDVILSYEGEAIKEEKFTSFDFALKEEAFKQSVEYTEAEEFFRERFYDCEGATAIPTDKDIVGTATPKILRSVVKKEHLIDISKTSIRPSNLFLGASAMVIGRFASTDDVRLATITNGRDGIEVQDNFGMLVKTLPIKVKTQNTSCKEYLESVQREMEDTLKHQGYSYVKVSSNYNFSAQILYAYQGGVISNYTLEGVDVKAKAIGFSDVKFPIYISIHEDEENYYVEVEYDCLKFSKGLMQSLADSIGAVAKKLVEKQGKSITELSVMTKKQEESIAQFNHEIHLSEEVALHYIYEKWAKEKGDKVALVNNGERLTFEELNKKANRVANQLLKLGVNTEDRIAFILPRTSNIIISMLGIMKAGCAYIPVDPDYPEDRIGHVLEDSGAKYIITDGTREFENGIDIHELLKNSNDNNPQININTDNLCYIIYTSGSTGKPKGVMLTHGGIINYIVDEERNIHVKALIEGNCNMISVTTVSFDMFLKEAFTSLMNGLTLILANDYEAKDPIALAKLFEKEKGTAFNATPSRMLQYMELPEIREALSRCKVIMAGGEAYPAALYNKLRKITRAKLINTYGPTEITVSSNGKVLESDDITIGAPLHNVAEEVMDIHGNPLPIGVTGELWIGGLGVSRGYFGNEAMTAERFVMYKGSRYYRSGDLAKFTEDGEIKILGRNDGQIKLRGLRIELGEIEKTLGEIEEIKSAVVVVRKINRAEHLCAYYTATQEIAPEKLREELLKSLTLYMVPTAYLQLEDMPMTPNGKIDRKVLPDAKLMDQGEYVKPETKEEQAYCDIFSNILQLEKIGAMDNFFDLGGTSLLVTQVTIDAGKAGFELNYGDVFANPTPRELANIGEREVEDNSKGIQEYDYSQINLLLGQNTLEAVRSGEYRELGNICITGTTGFLGVHVLKEFLDNEKGIAYCVVRGGKISAESRLKSMLVYYFSQSYEALFSRRIVVIDGDITKQEMFEQLKGLPIDTFFNCAANVKHFSTGTDIEDVNVKGASHCVDFCLEKGCTFIQVSTTSIGGMSIDNLELEKRKLSEQELYFGQDLSNKYVNSKFLAERYTLEAATKGLSCKIMRVGNLMAREEDGEFQANFNTNNFLSRLKAYSIIGQVPYADMGGVTEFAPIDCTAKAVVALAKTPEEARVFHPYNDHDVFIGDVIIALNEEGVTIKPSEIEAYTKEYKVAMLDKEKAKHLNSLIAYQEHGKRVAQIKSINNFTSQALLRQGFVWPITTPSYMKKFFKAMIELGFFDEDYRK